MPQKKREDDGSVMDSLKGVYHMGKQIIGAEPVPTAPKTRADQISIGWDKFLKMGGMRGDSPMVKSENVRTFKNKGMSEAEAIRLAHTKEKK